MALLGMKDPGLDDPALSTGPTSWDWHGVQVIEGMAALAGDLPRVVGRSGMSTHGVNATRDIFKMTDFNASTMLITDPAGAVKGVAEMIKLPDDLQSGQAFPGVVRCWDLSPSCPEATVTVFIASGSPDQASVLSSFDLAEEAVVRMGGPHVERR